MLSAELRKGFLEFFAKNGHTVVPSAPLVPRHDPTLMFVNAGMVQFKDVFTGKETRDYTRAASAQKCIRISGKHNDLENVGVTARHHTFFEMLGNFSFGDYFKEEAIVLSWKLLTQWGIDTSRLVVTVFDGEGGFAPDDEAARLWKQVTGLPDERILRLGAADNFWSMGDTGPCGPCSEIHYFHGGEPDLKRFGEEPDSQGHGWTEIWNLVFMQYDRPAKDAEPIPLPAPCVDTGAGLERMAGVFQGVSSNYDTDIMRRLVEVAGEIAGKTYTASASDDDVSMRVIADHARTTAFLIAEGVTPDKQKREYILRRVMRRAIHHGHRLGIDDLFLHRVALEVVALMSDAYPELAERRELIEKVTEGEEARFRQTLRRGMRLLDERFGELEGKSNTLSAEVVADLYTTYGFPIDLTEIIARERGYRVEAEEAQKIVGSGDETEGAIDPTAALDPAHRALAAEIDKVVFTGYETEHGKSEVRAIIRIVETDGREERKLVKSAGEGDQVEIAVATTPFYAESGGQVGDRGTIQKEGLTVRVDDTYKPLDDLVLHRGVVTEGAIEVGDHVVLEVDHALRQATRRNHSATHLLHWALRKVLGEHAQQKGSLVGPDVLRFDFAHNQPLTREQIEEVEDLVNAKILTNAPVETEVLPIAAAREKGAVAIFEEKYGDTVRVLTMTPDSVELCGGTHCSRLGDIGMFTIVSEGGTAAGVRRILAATGENALAHLRGLQHELDRARSAAKAQTAGDLAGKIEKIVQNERKLEKRVKELEKQLAEGGGGGGLDAMLSEARDIGDVRVLGVELAEGTNMSTLRELGEKLRDKLGTRSVVLVAAKNAGKAQLALVVSKPATDKLKAGSLIKGVASHVGGSGGGRNDMAQAGGTNVAGIGAAVAAIYDEVASALA